jgi:5-hydroxyisourate hydrolase-like protein (transthyretin family)
MSNKNQYEYIKPYRVRNMMVKALEVQPQPPIINQEPVPDNQLEVEQPVETEEVGYINVGVFTASGALPIQDAVVTVYHTYDEGEEHVLYHIVTDESGRVPTMEIPIEYTGEGQQTNFIYSTYNLRVQAIGYYTVNILDVQVFPNISTDFRINLIPVAQGETPEGPGQTIIIPERPVI